MFNSLVVGVVVIAGVVVVIVVVVIVECCSLVVVHVTACSCLLIGFVGDYVGVGVVVALAECWFIFIVVRLLIVIAVIGVTCSSVC